MNEQKAQVSPAATSTVVEVKRWDTSLIMPLKIVSTKNKEAVDAAMKLYEGTLGKWSGGYARTPDCQKTIFDGKTYELWCWGASDPGIEYVTIPEGFRDGTSDGFSITGIHGRHYEVRESGLGIVVTPKVKAVKVVKHAEPKSTKPLDLSSLKADGTVTKVEPTTLKDVVDTGEKKGKAKVKSGEAPDLTAFKASVDATAAGIKSDLESIGIKTS